MKKAYFYSKYFTPAYQTEGAAGMDLQVCTTAAIPAFDQYNEPQIIRAGSSIEIPAGWRVKIPTGYYTQIPEGSKALILLRSSTGWKKGLIIPNSVGLVDSDYRGEWFITLYNPLAVPVTVEHLERIAQAVFDERYEWIRVDAPEKLEPTTRGDGGFGSTGFTYFKIKQL